MQKRRCWCNLEAEGVISRVLVGKLWFGTIQLEIHSCSPSWHFRAKHNLLGIKMWYNVAGVFFAVPTAFISGFGLTTHHLSSLPEASTIQIWLSPWPFFQTHFQQPFKHVLLWNVHAVKVNVTHLTYRAASTFTPGSSSGSFTLVSKKIRLEH